MAKEIKAGMKCRVVDSSVGMSGASVGRIVRVAERADPPVHVKFGPMWDCEPADGKGPFLVKITSQDMQHSENRTMSNASFAGIWLEPIEDDPEPPKQQERERELTH